MMTDTTRTIAERYQSATNTSDLTMDTSEGVRNTADILTAAGAIMVRRMPVDGPAETLERHQRRTRDLVFGEQLTRLRSDWDGTTKPRDLNFSERLRLINAMPTLKPVVKTATDWLKAKEQAVTIAASVIYYWLDPVCQGCKGQRWKLVAGTNRAGNVKCPLCNGTGMRHFPTAPAAAWLYDHMQRSAGEFGPAISRKTR